MLALENSVVSVGVVPRRKPPLEIGNSIRVIPRESQDLDLFQHGLGPRLVGVELAQHREDGLVAGGLIPVDGTLEPDANLTSLRVALCTGGEMDVGKGATFFRYKV